MHMAPISEVSANSLNNSATYTNGTLRYSRRQVAILFGWLLWGDFAFTFFESIFGRFMPLYLKELNASNMLIGVATGSFAGLVNVLFLPNISQWSDRFRSRLGRRIPFLLVVSPLTMFSLLAIGFAPEMGAWLHQHVTSGWAPRLTNSTLLLSLICLFTVAFHFFNMILVNSYNWLLRDVVPQVLMSRFLSWFRIVGTVASVLFLWYVFPTMISHRQVTFFSIGIFYITAFMLMCWKVREGEYPEPEPRASDGSVLKTFGAYFRDGFSIPLYRNFFIAYVLVVIATGSAGSFLTLYARHIIGLEMVEMGRIYAYAALLSAVAYAPMGWLCEKMSAMRVALASLVALLVGAVLAYFLVGDKTSWLIYSLLWAIPTIGWGLGTLALSMQLFPEKAFGQFSSGMNVFGCGGLILGNCLIGEFMDITVSNYRLVFLWSAFFFAIAIIPMYYVYHGWKRHGGPNQYVPPLPIY